MVIRTMLDALNKSYRVNQGQSRNDRAEDEEIWSEALCSFSPEEIMRGMKYHIRHSKYYPKPSEIIDAIEASETSRPDALDVIAVRIQNLEKRYKDGLKTPAIQARWKYMCEQAYRISCRPDGPEKAEARRKWKTAAQTLDTITSLRDEAHRAGRTVPPVPAWLTKWYEELCEAERDKTPAVPGMAGGEKS